MCYWLFHIHEYTQKSLSFCQRLTLGFNGTLHSAFLKYSDVLYNGKYIV
ncbi:unnamed protein product, partial [Callosobruchus maculatus]